MELDQYSDEYLVELHSNGQTVDGKTTEMIATELALRGIKVEPAGQGTGNVVRYETPDTRFRRGATMTAYIIGSLFLAALITQFLSQTYLGRIISLLFLVSAGVAWLVDLLNTRAEKNQHRQNQLKKGLTPLILASADGDIQAVQQLISQGANVDETPNDGTTALMYAARNNHDAIIRILMGAGANTKLASVKGLTAAGIAERFNNREALTALNSGNSEA